MDKDVLRSRRRSSNWLWRKLGLTGLWLEDDLLVLLLKPLGQGIELLLIDEQVVALLHDLVEVCLHLAILLAP